MIEYHEIDLVKSTLIAAPALALAVAQMDFFEKGAKDFQVLKSPISKPLLRLLRLVSAARLQRTLLRRAIFITELLYPCTTAPMRDVFAAAHCSTRSRC